MMFDSWYVQLAATMRWYLELCIFVIIIILVLSFHLFMCFSLNLVSITRVELSKIPACS